MDKIFFNFNIKQFFKFLITGFIAVFIDGVVYFFLNFYVGISPELSKRISFITGAIFIFFINRSYVFQTERKHPIQYFLFCILYFISFIFNSISHDIIYINTQNMFLAFFVATSISTMINYIGQKFIVFR